MRNSISRLVRLVSVNLSVDPFLVFFHYGTGFVVVDTERHRTVNDLFHYLFLLLFANFVINTSLTASLLAVSGNTIRLLVFFLLLLGIAQ